MVRVRGLCNPRLDLGAFAPLLVDGRRPSLPLSVGLRSIAHFYVTAVWRAEGAIELTSALRRRLLH